MNVSIVSVSRRRGLAAPRAVRGQERLVAGQRVVAAAPVVDALRQQHRQLVRRDAAPGRSPRSG